MNKLRTAKGSLKDHNRFLADEIDDYAEQPDDYYFNLSKLPNTSQSHIEVAPKKTKASKRIVKITSRWPKFKPDFNLEIASQGIFDTCFGENLAKYLTISDIAKLLRTYSYLYRVFSKPSIWLNYIKESFGTLTLSSNLLFNINIMQYAKYLRCVSHDYRTIYKKTDKGNNDGIVFDTVTIAKNMKSEEEKLLAKNVVDFVTIKSEKTIETINRLALKGTLTGDIKISWMKEMNQVYVWVAGYHVQSESLQPFAGILLNRKYEEEIQLVKRTYFLNDRYFVIEMEEKSEDKKKIFEVFAIEPKDDWIEKKERVFCKLVLRESFVEKIKVKNIGDFLVLLLEGEKNKLSIHIFDLNGSVEKSENFYLDAGLDEVIASRAVTKSSLNLYLLDKESDIYLLSYSHESGVTLKKFDQKEEDGIHSTFPVKKYHYGTYQEVAKEEVQNKTSEYLMICKERNFYLLKFDTNELVPCVLPYNSNKESKLFSWTIFGNYLYLLIDTTIKICRLNFKDGSAVQEKMESIRKINFEGSTACWIFVNPCLTILMSAGSLDKYLNSSVQLLIGSTQRLGIGRDWMNQEVHFDECRLDKMLKDIASIKCKFEDERLLIQEADGRSYFRDFNVCEKGVEKEKYGWRVQTKYDLDELSIVSTEVSKENYTRKIDISIFPAEVKPELNKTKQNEKTFVTKVLFFENKNHENSKKKKLDQNWKNIEKKAETDEKVEKKENRKKGEKYYKNVRQAKHLNKMSD